MTCLAGMLCIDQTWFVKAGWRPPDRSIGGKVNSTHRVRAKSVGHFVEPGNIKTSISFCAASTTHTGRRADGGRHGGSVQTADTKNARS